MIAWTDRHCRYFHRQITVRARLYTEMIATGALLFGDVAAHLRRHPDENPVALQLGGSDPAELARCARLGEQWGYDEINLNCGCPSERVQRGAFGACLMTEPRLVADCVAAMANAVDIPVTVKSRIGIDRIESYDFVRDFVGIVSEAGCDVFIVHARNAWLKGLSPAENRNIPPLRYEFAYRLKRDFPDLVIVINGGIQSNDEIERHLARVDGAMIGRAAYHDPWMMSAWDARFLDGPQPIATPADVEFRMVSYMEREAEISGVGWPAIARHMLGLRRGQRGARLWRQVWSDQRLKMTPPAEMAARARIHLAEAEPTPV